MAKKRGTVKQKLQRREPSEGAEPLDRFVTSDKGDVQVAGLDLKAIRLDRIVPDPNQPRKTTPDETLADLAESIREQGVIQPIEVDYDETHDVFRLVHGERRWRAAKIAGLETIPAVIKPKPLDRATRLIRQLIENIQREDLNDIDRAAALIELREQMQRELDAQIESGEVLPRGKTSWSTKVTWSDVGQKVGLSPTRMTRLRRLLDLPPEIQADIRAGVVTEKDTRSYQGLTPSQQVELHRARKEEALSPDQVQRAASILKAQAKQRTLTESSRPVAQVVAEVKAAAPPSPAPTEARQVKAPPVVKPSPDIAAPPDALARALTRMRDELERIAEMEKLSLSDTEKGSLLLVRILAEIEELASRIRARLL
ncbi:MAG TPA: ParB/RepB/Spo0J family partition protein [Anaerolineae bacterium]|nr:ParB/RepB/Spo0J family partition protein [Anaerolineae bacterium]